MALLARYNAFLADPTTDSLADTASLHFITTLTTINEPIGILKHIRTQQQVINKKEEKVLNAIENNDSLCIEMETTLQFVLGGGTYLPGLDDNFLAEKIVTLPILHIVTFDSNQKIVQIRLHWDQASLLKAVDTIGARGRNWPVHSGKDQTSLIIASVAATPHSPAPTAVEAAVPAEERNGRTMSRGVDPHTSLDLFSNRDTNTSRDDSPRHSVIPRASAKPAPRAWGELFANGEQAGAIAERSPSPSKLDNPIKSGAGRHYQDNRLFSGNADEIKEKGIKTDAKKYSHFEFGEADFKESPIKNNRTKHMSQWDFHDFVTPQKLKERKTAFPVRNFDLSEAAAHDESAMKAPVWTQHVPHERPDAAAHFDIGDMAPSPESAVEKPLIARTSKSLGLYEDRTVGNDDNGNDAEKTPKATAATEQEKMPLSNITNANVNNTHRSTFETHWEPRDHSSPTPTTNENGNDIGSVKRVADPTKRNTRDMGPHWQHFDESSTEPQSRGIKILGNGTGSSREADKRWWG